MLRRFNKFLFVFVILFLQDCASSSAGIATSNIPVVNKKYQVLGPVEGIEKWYTLDFAILGFPLQEPPVNALMDKLMKEKQADALINIRFWNDKMILLFLTINRIGMNAEAIKFEDEGSINVKKPK